MMRKLIPLSVALMVGACVQQPVPLVTTAPLVIIPSPPPKPKITAVQLLGQSQHWVLKNLGKPAFIRTDMQANIWQYKNSHCVLNVFLYTGEPTDPAPAKVLHFDARDMHGHNTDRNVCLSTLQD